MPSTIRSRLIGLVAAVLVPATALSGYLAYKFAKSERQALEIQRTDDATKLTFLVDGEITALLASLQILANTPQLVAGDLAAFRKVAETVTGDKFAVIALLDETGQQVMSTFIAPGEPLPRRLDMTPFEPVFKGRTIVSDVLRGTAVKRPVISIAVPVAQDGRVRYALSGVVYPERFGPLFEAAGINSNWAAAIVDRSGNFVARNIDPEKYIGNLARPALAEISKGTAHSGDYTNVTHEGVATGNSFRRSSVTGWTTAVSVPIAVLYEASNRAMRWVGAGALLLLLGSIALATYLAGQITQSITSFSEAATALVKGRALPETSSHIAELAEVRAAFEITEAALRAREKADEHARFLLQELSHRSKNLIAVVQAVANQTAQSSKSLPAFQEAFSMRLQGLSVSNDLLVKKDGSGASLRDLILGHLAPFVGDQTDRVHVRCPNVMLSANATQALGLAFHELATNAHKYGALSAPDGHVTVTGEIIDAEALQQLAVSWTERGGPLVQPPTRKGFGTTVIDRMAAASVGGTAQLNYDPAGFRWVLMISDAHFSLGTSNKRRDHRDFEPPHTASAA